MDYIGNGDHNYTVSMRCVSLTGYLTHGNSQGEARGIISHHNNSEGGVTIFKERLGDQV